MGIELELGFILMLMIVGTSSFAVFELETLSWRKQLKWLLITGTTVGLYYYVGHLALLLPALFIVMGISIHILWCRKHCIHPVSVFPRRRYYELRGWKWPD